ncbi:hypothetical protein DXG01_000971 [Tephrocybe rancida]|nr:hypothetical protein DXG01_000971 [Tephrocybe rancida]
MAALPPEMWASVAGHLTDEDLERLSSLNHIFYNITLDRRYRDLDLSTLDASSLLEISVELLQYPGIAAKVRTLKLSPEAACNAIATRLSRSPEAPKVTRKWRTLSKLYGATQNRVLPPSLNFPLSSPVKREARKLVITNAAKSLVNVTNVSISGSATDGCCPFLITLLPIISSRLESLAFDLTVSTFERIVATPDFLHLPDLRHMSISLHPELPSTGAGPAALLFLNNIRSLESLSFEAYGIHDGIRVMPESNNEFGIIPHLVDYLDPFSRYQSLKKLCLTVPLDHGIPDTSALNRLLCAHAPSLTDLTFIGKPCEFCSHLPHLQHPTWSFQWRDTCLHGTALTRLQNLTLQSHRTFSCPPPFAHSLRSLVLPGQRVRSTEYATLFAYLATQERLEELDLTVEGVAVSLFVGLVGCTPCLRRLVLRERRWPDGMVVHVHQVPTNLPWDTRRTFPPRKHRVQFEEWPLADISVWSWSPTFGDALWWNVMNSLARCVPALERFAGETIPAGGRGG